MFFVSFFLDVTVSLLQLAFHLILQPFGLGMRVVCGSANRFFNFAFHFIDLAGHMLLVHRGTSRSLRSGALNGFGKAFRPVSMGGLPLLRR
jgi:hypothetical protein